MRVWRLDFSTADGVEGTWRLELGDAREMARFEAVARGPGLGRGVLVVRDDDVPPPRGSALAVHGDGLWAEAVCEEPGEHWTFGMEAFGLRVDDDEAAADADAWGERVAVGADLEWETEGTDPGHGTVHGELLVGTARIPVEGIGRLTVPPPSPA